MQRRTPMQAPPFGQNRRRGKETSMVVEIALKVSKKEKPWILDSGCSLHMTGDSKMLKGVAKYDEGSVKFGNDGALKIQGIGAAEIGVEKLKSKKMLYVEGLKYNLISVSQLCNDGHEVTFNKSGCIVKRLKDGVVLTKSERTHGNLYQAFRSINTCYISTKNENLLWYRRLGHLRQKGLNKLSKNETMRDVPKLIKERET
jgi:hypothetical protein